MRLDHLLSKEEVEMCFTVELSKEASEGAERDSKRIPVAMRSGETPVPIPNTMVKT